MKMWSGTYTKTYKTPLPLFDAAEAERHAAEGIELAAKQRASLVVEAREIAVSIARRKGTVNADDVVREMCVLGYGVHALGNAAGAIFRDARFTFTGAYVRSERVHGKGNLLRVWKLK